MLIDIVSLATGEVIAENLTGEGSARRWCAARKLTPQGEVDDSYAQEWAITTRQMLAQYAGQAKEVSIVQGQRPNASLYVAEPTPLSWRPAINTHGYIWTLDFAD